MNEDQEIQVEKKNERKKQSAPVTIDDVRSALVNEDGEDTSPFHTNAEKIRIIHGSGSNKTIQKHLESLREEINEANLKASISHNESTTPKLPGQLVEAMGSIWNDAWRAAQILTLSKVEKLTIEKENLQQTVSAQSADISELTDNMDELEESAVNYDTNINSIKNEYEAQIEQENSEYENKIEELNNQVEAKDALILAANSEISSIKKDASHEREMAEKNALLATTTMQNTIDRLNDQVSELKALMIASANQKREE